MNLQLSQAEFRLVTDSKSFQLVMFISFFGNNRSPPMSEKMLVPWNPLERDETVSYIMCILEIDKDRDSGKMKQVLIALSPRQVGQNANFVSRWFKSLLSWTKRRLR